MSIRNDPRRLDKAKAAIAAGRGFAVAAQILHRSTKEVRMLSKLGYLPQEPKPNHPRTDQ